ncbi:excisionase [Citrobacter braakii]|uniref:excisionase n=1 Tax=Citrobacter braakii TaxID=57706 RepID=UPI004039383F
MARTVLIQDWAKGPNGFGYPQNKRKLVTFAKTNQISPPAMKDGGKWVVYEDAKFIGVRGRQKISDELSDDAKKLVERALNGKTT